jgi:flagellin FlaB
MVRKLMKILHRQQKGITGLETAIILIAFVVVAAVFAYTVLSAGLFSTQKSQEAVYNGLSEVQSTLEMRGDVVAYKDVVTDTSYGVGAVEFTVSLSTDSTDPIDLTPSAFFDGDNGDALSANVDANGNAQNVTQITFSDSNMTIPDCYWTVSWVGANNSADGNYLLDRGEKAIITVYLHSCTNTGSTGDTATWTDPTGEVSPLLGADNTIGAYDNFTLEVKPPKGAVLTISRSTPAYLDPVINLH